MNNPQTFPRDFKWGVATAAYQIEGGHDAGGKGQSRGDRFADIPGKIVHGNHARVACDHYHRYQEDVALLRTLGVGAYRLSLSWSRLLPPGTGRVNPAGLAFYDRLIDSLMEAGIEPFVTLFHGDYPAELNDRGGWLNRDSADWFAEYCAVSVRHLGDRVKHWLTLNEPQCSIGFGYHEGQLAPRYARGWAEVLKAGHHQLLAHGKGVQAIRAASPRRCSVGWAPAGQNIGLPMTENPADIEAARKSTFAVKRRDPWNLAWWLDPVYLGRYPEDGIRLYGKDMPTFPGTDMAVIRQPLDMMALNVYKGGWVRSDSVGEPQDVPYPIGDARGALPWLNVTPTALYWGPRFCMERYGQMPFYITENGFCSNDWVQLDGEISDPARIDYLRRYLLEYRRLGVEGYPIVGYFVWSFLENFECADGYRGRFGLVHVDFESQERTPKQSYHWYRGVIGSRGASLDMPVDRLSPPPSASLPS